MRIRSRSMIARPGSLILRPPLERRPLHSRILAFIVGPEPDVLLQVERLGSAVLQEGPLQPLDLGAGVEEFVGRSPAGSGRRRACRRGSARRASTSTPASFTGLPKSTSRT